MSKIVHSFDAQTGVYQGPVELDEGDLSPLDSTKDEPVYLIPGNCLEVPPPAVPVGKQAVAVDGEWHLQDLPPESDPDPLPTLEQRAAVLLAGVDVHLNAAARAKRYDNIGAAALRAGYPGPFHDEGMAFAMWMDAVYAECYSIMASVQAGEMAEPTLDELIAKLPQLQLPA